jgi:hypothetical protein
VTKKDGPHSPKNRSNIYNFSTAVTDDQKKFMAHLRKGIDKSLSEGKTSISDALQRVLNHLPTDPVLALCEAHNISMPQKWTKELQRVFLVCDIC